MGVHGFVRPPFPSIILHMQYLERQMLPLVPNLLALNRGALWTAPSQFRKTGPNEQEHPLEREICFDN